MGRLLSKLKKAYYRLFIARVVYIPMRLPVEKITEEFENFLREKVNQKINNSHIREANLDDLSSLIFLFDEAWHSTTMPYHPLSKKKIITKIFYNPDKKILIADIDSFDCGFAFIGQINDDIGEISALGILPEYQHKGIGTLLGIASWDFFRERGVNVLQCKVYKDNQISKSFLKGIGFEENLPQNSEILYKKIPF